MEKKVDKETLKKICIWFYGKELVDMYGKSTTPSNLWVNDVKPKWEWEYDKISNNVDDDDLIPIHSHIWRKYIAENIT